MKNKYNISKELFEAVMSEKIIDYRGVFIDHISGTYNNKTILDGITIVAADGGIISCSVNNFFFKCKDWANKNGYRLLNGSHDYNNQTICLIYKDYDYIGDFCEKIKADSEQQAVFDACQWILDNKGK